MPGLSDLRGIYTTGQIIKASEFKATCLKLMDEVAETGKEIVITKNGEPVAKLIAYQHPRKAPWGADKGRIRILGDIISPVDVEWEAEVNPDRVLNPELPPHDA